ncbi:hypothetical protein B0I35DRAFT_481003 [Stachybotrys elegans]|uniref:Uncharacterized protein n=1 Tax=Stachybotrys elegans TaxID=80388 RepID=A0A8K0WNS3_9HYPO|nr:hypothetical protein B0I35DRAFT_481003 [Stachybotrys elegans]
MDGSMPPPPRPKRRSEEQSDAGPASSQDSSMMPPPKPKRMRIVDSQERMIPPYQILDKENQPNGVKGPYGDNIVSWECTRKKPKAVSEERDSESTESEPSSDSDKSTETESGSEDENGSKEEQVSKSMGKKVAVSADGEEGREKRAERGVYCLARMSMGVANCIKCGRPRKAPCFALDEDGERRGRFVDPRFVRFWKKGLQTNFRPLEYNSD